MSGYRAEPWDAAAEEGVLGGMLLSAPQIDVAAAIVDAEDFYPDSHRAIFRAILDLHRSGALADVITVADALRGNASHVDRVQQIFAGWPDRSRVDHYATIVKRHATDRQLQAIGLRIGRGEIDLPDALAELRKIERRSGDQLAFAGVSHAEALTFQVPSRLDLVEALVEAGTVGLLCGLPESGKSILAMMIAFGVASGQPVLGREIVQPGPVGYWAQDGSRARQFERLQRYAAANSFPNDLPITWHVGEGLRLPRERAALLREVGQAAQQLVVLDSLYNFLPLDGGLREEDVAGILATLKTEIADATGATVLVVDHSPWPTEGNRGQNRPYGSVFKAAVARFTISLARTGDEITLTVSGNDIGRTTEQLVFDSAMLSLGQAGQAQGGSAPRGGSSDLLELVLAYLAANSDWWTAAEVAKGVGKRRESVGEALDRLVAAGAVERQIGPPGRSSTAVCFRVVVPAPGQAGTTASAVTATDLSGTPPLPYRGEGSPDESGVTRPDEPDDTVEIAWSVTDSLTGEQAILADCDALVALGKGQWVDTSDAAP